jgi:hypothetical protein
MCREVISPALDVVEKEWREARNKAVAEGTKGAGAGSLVITGPQDQMKFFRYAATTVFESPGLVAQRNFCTAMDSTFRK